MTTDLNEASVREAMALASLLGDERFNDKPLEMIVTLAGIEYQAGRVVRGELSEQEMRQHGVTDEIIEATMAMAACLVPGNS